MRVFSFFSYKGGAGRSTLAYNVIPIMAAEHFKPTAEKPMIVVDTDIDSCGMSYLVKADKKATDTNCVQYLLANGCPDGADEYPDIKDHPFIGQLVPVGNAYGYPDNDAILLLPAKDGLAIEDGKDNYKDSGSSPFLQKLQSFVEACESYDIPAIILDSAVGNTAAANISNECADTIVCVMRPTLQFTGGTFRYLCSLESDDLDGISGTQKMFSLGKHIVLVPNVIPQGEVHIDGHRYPNYAVETIRDDFFARFGNSDLCLHNYHFDMLDEDEFGIPAFNRFMWCEGQLYSRDRDDMEADEKLVLDRYYKLANVLCSIETDLF